MYDNAIQHFIEEFVVHMKSVILKKRWIILTVVIIFAAVCVILFTRRLDGRIEKRNLNYLEDATIQMADATDVMICNAIRSLKMAAGIIQSELDSSEVNTDMLNRVACDTPFDYIEFVDTEGMHYLYDGRIICSQGREAYIKGIKGESGVDVVRDARVTNDNMVVCYTPLRFGNKIIGVLEGMMEEEALTNIRESSFFGYISKSYICKKDGTIILGDRNDISEDNIVDLFNTGNIADDELSKKIRGAMTSGEVISYEYSGSIGSGSACIAPIADSELVLVRTLSSKITNQMRKNALNDVFGFQLVILVLVLLIVIVLTLDSRKEKTKLMVEKYKSNCIVEAIIHLFNRILIVNLMDMTYKLLSDDNVYPVPINETGNYNDIIKYLNGKMIYADNVCDVNEMLSREYLRENLTENNPYILYDYCVDEEKQKWVKTAVIRLDTDSEGNLTHVLFATEDVSKLKQKDIKKLEAMRRSYEQASASNDIKSELISKMSDGIKSPMDKIIDMAEKAKDNAGDNEKLSECLEMVKTSGRYLLQLLNEITDISKIESGEKYFDKKVFSIKDAVYDMAEMFETDLKEKNLKLKVEFKSLWNEEVIGDCTRIKQALANFLVNSIKYTPKNGHINLGVRERRSDRSGYGLYEFTVENDGNSGIGVQTCESDSELGITISYNIVRMMGGNIEFTSKRGKGSCYIVILYLQKSADSVLSVN